MASTPTHIKTGMRIVTGIVCSVLLFLAGVYVGYQNRPAFAKVVDVVHKEPPVTVSDETDFAPFWKAWSIAESKFPGAEDITAEERMYGAIQGMLASFDDPYTTFFPPAENKEFETQITGEFSGVGIELGVKDGVLTVIAPLKGTPAERAGVQAGDKIIKIDDAITADFDIDRAVELIRGEAGTPVTLTVLRGGEADPRAYTITRATITLPTVDTEALPEDGVFVISLYNFSTRSGELFGRAMNEYLRSGYTRLVLDLRGNPGGYLNAAVQMAGMFLPEGEVVVKEIGKSPDDVQVETASGRRLFPEGHQLVILVDQGSASASEILAGALSEHGVGTLVGTKTFGKGSVQEVVGITPDTSLKVTVAKWYTPNGVSISDSGLTPDVVVEEDDDQDTDLQLAEAIRILKKR